jgi:hypothetical protein
VPDLHGWITQQIDHVGCWLAEHRCPLAAELLWRACRMW